jgi:NAD(P)-dependent dehydrogenase (short-subunit alcohol dehydrogenase family)
MSVILITGAGTGIGRLAARSLAAAGHTVYATMRDPQGRNAERADEMHAFAAEHGLDLRVRHLDVLDETSARETVAAIDREQGALDVVVHNAAHLYFGVTEAFTPEQVLSAFDTNALGALRVNRAALPVLRRRRSGLLLWVGSGTTRVVPPFLAPYTAAKAAMDSFAESTAVDVARYGVETSIVMPGPFTVGTEHFPNAAHAQDTAVAAEYELIAEAVARNGEATEALFAPGVVQDVQAVADEIVRIVGLPAGTRPYRSTVDFADFGDIPVNAVADAQRRRLLIRMGLADAAPAVR